MKPGKTDDFQMVSEKPVPIGDTHRKRFSIISW